MEEPNELLVSLGRRIKLLRRRAGMDQEELAYKCGMEFQNISRIENGRQNASILTLARIAKALEIRVKDLIDF